jgi:hypothetical protein
LIRILSLSIAQRIKSIIRGCRGCRKRLSTASLWSYALTGGLRKLIRHLARTKCDNQTGDDLQKKIKVINLLTNKLNYGWPGQP